MERVMPSPEELETALLTLNSKLGNRVEWAVDGSTSLKLQGKDVEPHDIDILTSRKGAEMIATLLEEYLEKPLRYGETEKYRSYFCVVRLGRVKVEVMGDLQVFRKGKWTEVQNPRTARIRHVSLKGGSIPVTPIEFLESTGYVTERLERERLKR